MPRRSPGEGSISRRKDGLWQASLQLDGRRKTIYGRTRQEVAEKLRTLQGVARENGRIPDGGKLTLGEYLRQWLEQAETRLRPKTRQEYNDVARVHILPHLAHVKLSRLPPLHLARLHARLRKGGTSSFRLEKAHTLLHKALSDAHRWGLIPSNPAAPVDAPKREHRERELWTPEQVSRFIRAVREGDCGQYGNLLGFLLASGCRVGEALGLRWSDVDLRAGAVRVERQVTELRCKPLESEPKTKAGVRTLALPAWGTELLHRQRVQVAEWRLRAGPAWRESGRVFPTNVGSVPLQGNVRRALHEACDRLSLPRIRVHDLRHLHLSLLAMNNVPLRVAQQRAGHATASVTMAVYSHVLGDADRQAAEALEKALGRP